MNRSLIALVSGATFAALATTAALAQQKEVTIAYQDMVVPYRLTRRPGNSRRPPATRSTGSSSAAAAR